MLEIFQNKYLKIIALVLLVLVILFLLFGLVSFAYQKSYADKVYNGVYLGQYNLGGMTKTEITSFVEKFNNRLAQEGLILYYNDPTNGQTNIKLDTINKGSDSSIELAKLDSASLTETASKVGKNGQSIFNDFIDPIKLLFIKNKITASVNFKDELWQNIKLSLDPYAKKVTNANVSISSTSPLKYTVIPESAGSYFDYEEIKKDLSNNLSVLDLSPVVVTKKDFVPKIKEAQAQLAVKNLTSVLSYGNISLNYTDPKTKLNQEWTIKPDEYSSWLEVVKDDKDNYVFSFKKEMVEKYLKTIKSNIEQEPINAKFVLENGKVKQFQASQSGIKVDLAKTYLDLNKAFKERNYGPTELTKSVTISVSIAEPEIQMADANNLGIKDVLGVGISSYKYSHTNRIKNIANAVAKLNGVVIKPGEIFSTNKYAGPYTSENGYWPEEVIVGDLIKIEIGGGMCQIGTTMFRAAMNSGMPITERTNHSLVVQYYADPVNGNPGTDATLYDPYLDLKFKNDTDNYMLLQAEMNVSTLELRFTLWGKNDGRKGSYTNPVVSQWYYPGKKVYRESNDLKPSEERCQNSFVGAQASFTYTIITSSSQKINRVFDSYYRPQPQICMVGPSLDSYCKDNASSKECENYIVTSSSIEAVSN